jgi:hypothetical protein
MGGAAAFDSVKGMQAADGPDSWQLERHQDGVITSRTLHLVPLMQVDLSTVRAIFDRVLDGTLSRKQASDWAQTRCEADDGRRLEVRPESDRSAVRDALMFLWGCDLKASEDAYLHASSDFLAHRPSAGEQVLPPILDRRARSALACSGVRLLNNPVYRAACLSALDLLPAAEAARLACSALEGGFDSPSLGVLSAVGDDDQDLVRPILHRALRELGVPLPSRREAALNLAYETAQRVIRSELSPYEGARGIWSLRLQASCENISELDPFVYAECALPERPDDRRRTEAGILAAVAGLLGSGE